MQLLTPEEHERAQNATQKDFFWMLWIAARVTFWDILLEIYHFFFMSWMNLRIAYLKEKIFLIIFYKWVKYNLFK